MQQIFIGIGERADGERIKSRGDKTPKEREKEKRRMKIIALYLFVSLQNHMRRRRKGRKMQK